MSNLLPRILGLLRRPRVPDLSLHVNRVKAEWKHRPWRSFDMITIVSLKPAILLTGCHPSRLTKYLQPMVKNQKLTIFYRAGWSLEDPYSFNDRINAIKAAQCEFPLHSYIFAVNTPHEAELVNAAGVRAEFLNENAFIDEFAFHPRAEQPKEFDAVIDAQIAAYKRLELAEQINSLLIITFVMRERFDPAYAQEVRTRLSHATWANGPFWESTYRKLNREEVAETYRRARVGLCLSAIEGANLASIQYLLSGLSVVSTESLGGRDIFFDPAYARVVPPSSEAVAAAVSDLVRTGLAPAEIRARTLAKIAPIRQHFSDLLTKELGHPGVDDAWWKDFNKNRRISYQDLRVIGATLQRGRNGSG